MALKKAGFRGPFSVQAGPFYLRANSPGSFAMLAAIRRASSLLSSWRLANISPATARRQLRLST
jgi:hypothetical protein